MTPFGFRTDSNVWWAYGPPRPPHVLEPAPPAPHDLTALRMQLERVRALYTGGRLALAPWIDNWTKETAEIRAAYRLMLAEPAVKATLYKKVQAVAQLDVQVHAQNPDDPREREANTEFGGHVLRRVLGGATKVIFNILFPGLMDGWSVNEPVWDRIPDGQWAGKWAWRAVKMKDTRRLNLVVDSFLNVEGVRSIGPGGPTVFDPADFLIFRHLSLFENPFGLSDLRAAYRSWWIKDSAWKFRSQGLERWTLPFLIGRWTNANHIPELRKGLEDAGSQRYTILPAGIGKDDPGAVIEALDIGTRGESDFKSAIADLNEEIAIGIAGSYLQQFTSQQSDPRGSSVVQRSTAETFEWAAGLEVASVLTHQALPPLIRANFAGVAPGYVTLGAVNEADLGVMAENDLKLQQLGLALSRKDAYTRYARVQPADEGDELAPPGQGGGPGGPGGGGGAPLGALPFGERDRRLLRRIWRAYCDHGPNKGKPGPCPKDGGEEGGGGEGSGAAGRAPAAAKKHPRELSAGLKKQADAGQNELDFEAAGMPLAPLSKFDPRQRPAETTVSLADLHASETQGGADLDVAQQYADPNHPRAKDPINVVKDGRGRLVILDGNHRVAGALLRGDESVRVRVFDALPGGKTFSDRDRRRLRRSRHAFCDQGPNKGKPGPCPEGSSTAAAKPGHASASPRAAVGRELEAANPPGKDWARASAAAAITDALAKPDPPAVPTNPAAPPEGQAKLALRAVKVLDDQDFTRSRLASRAADDVAAGHPDGPAALGEARQRAGERHAAAAAQVNDHARSLAGALSDPPADRPLGRADLRGGHVIDPAGADPAVREAATALAAKLPHAAAGESRVAVADTPAAKAALRVLTQLGAAQPLGEPTAEAQHARQQVLEGLTDEQRRALRG
jgi:Protein of unknown function (DUF935)